MSVKDNMDLEEEIALLKKENEELKIDMINHTTQNYSEWKKEQETLAIGLVREDLKRAEEENKELKKENEKLKDGGNTAKMIDKLNDEFSVLQDKNIKLEEENKENIEAKVKLYKEWLKIKEEMDLLFDYTDYPEDMINPDYSKADGIGEWMCAREDELCDFQSETRNLEEKNKQLKKEIERLEKLREAVRKELDVEPDPTQETIIKKLKEAMLLLYKNNNGY